MITVHKFLTVRPAQKQWEDRFTTPSVFRARSVEYVDGVVTIWAGG